MHHALFIEAEVDAGVEHALALIEGELGLKALGNPDVVVLKHGLLSVSDARRIAEAAASLPMRGKEKAIVIAAGRAYHEAQNALLKVFEEPAPGTHLFLVLPSAGMLLPTLKSRMQVRTSDVLFSKNGHPMSIIPKAAEQFLSATREQRAAIAKKLATGDDEDERRANRDLALAIVNGAEAALLERGLEEHAAALADIALLRSYLYERAAPVRMILEHLSLIIPKDLK